ncbi:hypothetical protein [Methanosarcina horonobensis]|uniref:hypothetical protein n=1 Tax=Methanosarcina horonobensis TaxID=418008 RepID=UPI00064E25FB|nr:hypothetical protein [Methanosarcina horonobensis]
MIKRNERIRIADMSPIQSSSECEYFGSQDECIKLYALCKACPCNQCSVREDCRETQNEMYDYIEGIHGISITCPKEYALELSEIMLGIDKYVKRKVKMIPGCKVDYNFLNSFEYVNDIDN